MSANPIIVKHPEKWTRMEFACECGTTCQVDVEFSGPGFDPIETDFSYLHCVKGKERRLPGRIIQVWLEDSWTHNIGRAAVIYSAKGIVGRGFDFDCVVRHGTRSTRVTTIQTGSQLSREEVEKRFASAPDVSKFISIVSSDSNDDQYQ